MFFQFLRGAFCVGLLLCCIGGRYADARERSPVSIDDVLNIAMLGDARFSPDGAWLAYTLVPPYDELEDYSYWLYAHTLSGHQIWIKDLSRDARPRLQPGLNGGATNYLVDFSPDGRRLIVLEHHLGRFRLGACRVGRDNCVWFDGMLDMRDPEFTNALYNERLVWTSDETLILATRDRDLPGGAMHSRGATGDILWRAWNQAWRGQGITASEMVSTSRDRSHDWAQGELVEFNIRTGAQRVLSEGRFAGALTSPDQRMVAAARLGERVRPNPGDFRQRPETHPQFDRRYALYLIDAQTGDAAIVPTPFNIDPNSIAWAADGRSLAVFGWNAGETARDGRFFVLDVATREAVERTAPGLELAKSRNRNDGFDWRPGPARAVLIDQGLIVLGRMSPEAGYDWHLIDDQMRAHNLSQGLSGVSPHPLYSDGASVVISASSGVYRISGDGSRRQITPPFDGAFRSVLYEGGVDHNWAPDFSFNATRLRNPFEAEGRFVLDEGRTGADDQVWFVRYDTPESSTVALRVALPGAKVMAASLSARAAIISVRDGAAVRLFLVREGREPLELVHINTHLNELAHPQMRDVSYELRDPGERFEPRQTGGCLSLPADHEEGQRHPLVIEVYPGGYPRSCSSLETMALPNPISADLWTARGFAYFRPAIPLDFARLSDTDPIGGMDEIVDQAIDALVEQGFADRNRVVLFGFSQGGVSSLFVAAHSEKFAAVISMNGWSNFLSHYFGARGLRRYFHLDQNGGDNRWRYECVGEGVDNLCPFGFGEAPFEDPALYARMSPVTMADRIRAPVLLVHSDLDYIDMAQYDEMFGALYRAGKEARYVRYWGEGHAPSSPANIRDLWSRIDAFLAEHDVSRRSSIAN